MGEIKRKDTVAVLIKALKDEQTDVQKIAIDALGKIATPEAKEAITKVIKNKKENAYLRQAAKNVLTNFSK